MSQKKSRLSDIGRYGLIERVSQKVENKRASSICGIGDDCAVVQVPSQQLFGSVLLLEGMHFDLIYTPLAHLGYKAVVVAMTDVLAMNGGPEQINVNLGVSQKIELDGVDDLVSGMMAACDDYGIDFCGFHPHASLTGLTISIAVLGTAHESGAVLRSTASAGELLCLTGDLGASLMGLHLLEREKRVLKSTGTAQPDFGSNDYVLQRQLKPDAPVSSLEKMHALSITPTAMVAVKEGLAASAMLLSKASGLGCRIYEGKIPLHQKTLKVADELSFNPLVAALNGGEDYELLFTIKPEVYEAHKSDWPKELTVLGYMCESSKGYCLVSQSDDEIDLKAQGWGLSK